MGRRDAFLRDLLLTPWKHEYSDGLFFAFLNVSQAVESKSRHSKILTFHTLNIISLMTYQRLELIRTTRMEINQFPTKKNGFFPFFVIFFVFSFRFLNINSCSYYQRFQ